MKHSRGYVVLDEDNFGLPNAVVLTLADGTEEIHTWNNCIHHYKKSEPSRLDKNGVLIWECVFCKKQISST